MHHFNVRGHGVKTRTAQATPLSRNLLTIYGIYSNLTFLRYGRRNSNNNVRDTVIVSALECLLIPFKDHRVMTSRLTTQLLILTRG